MAIVDSYVRARSTAGVGWRAALVLAVLVSPTAAAGQTATTDHPTFAKDIAPILQRSCQKCHRPGSVAPMSLITYQDVRPWARAIRNRTALRDQPGVMPPWYIERNIGIQQFKDDPSLSEQEIAKIARWVENGAPEGDPADMPPPRAFVDADEWEIGEPDLIVTSDAIEVPALAPDWWGDQTRSRDASSHTADRHRRYCRLWWPGRQLPRSRNSRHLPQYRHHHPPCHKPGKHYQYR